MALLGVLQWDPSRVFFEIPYIHFPVYWYGLFFALGYQIAYLFVKKALQPAIYDPYEADKKNQARLNDLMSSLTLWVTLFSVVGARLAYILFYGWPHYLSCPEDIINLRQGGLSSHGGVLATLITLWAIAKIQQRLFAKLTCLTLFDAIAIASGWLGACIRMGNFINQEIIGTPTTQPWGVLFMHPAEGPAGIYHPVQLYEGIGYALLSTALYVLWKKQPLKLGTGVFTGLLLIGLTLIRFTMEFFKMPQGELQFTYALGLQMGQFLSVPFFMLGVALCLRHFLRKKTCAIRD
jgi:phosphatidylglycerol:prolipoprotein diacylglycerol transferase